MAMWNTSPMSKPLVTVVIPAFNASRTIAATLDSVVAQTYDTLEILVVDDGSTDSTAEIVLAYRDCDPRITLIKQANGGVAAARNTGIKAARGHYIAPIDADDLWHPTKIAKQMAVLLAGGADMGLVYSPCRIIDANNGVLRTSPFYGCQGWVFCQHIYINFVGNGSSLLFRKKVALEVGGYDSKLRAWGAEGSEDLLFQFRVAARYRFGCAPEYLIGYRHLPERMSSNAERMFKSYKIALELIRAEYPGVPQFVYDWVLAKKKLDIAIRFLHNREFHDALELILYSLRHDSFSTLLKLFLCGFRKGKRTLKSLTQHFAEEDLIQRQSRSFYDFDPAEGRHLNYSYIIKHRMKQLAKLDQGLAEIKGYQTEDRKLANF